jgi:hypothetical protein
MHLLIPFAAPLSDAGQQALRSLRLPALSALLREFTPTLRDDGDEWSLSTPHERAFARELGLHGADGTLPWAAHEAQRAGLQVDDRAWGLVTPVHWHVGSDHVNLLDPALLDLDEAQSRALFDAVRPLFNAEGWQLVWQAPLVWLAAHDVLHELPTASLDRAIGRSVERWLPTARPVRQLQVQAQMAWHGHPVNEAREASGALPVNSFWLSGCGRHQAPQGTAPTIDDRLRRPALADDWPAWTAAWHALDASLTSDITVLTLAGERSAQRLEALPRGLWSRLKSTWQGSPAAALLETL